MLLNVVTKYYSMCESNLCVQMCVSVIILMVVVLVVLMDCPLFSSSYPPLVTILYGDTKRSK